MAPISSLLFAATISLCQALPKYSRSNDMTVSKLLYSRIYIKAKVHNYAFIFLDWYRNYPKSQVREFRDSFVYVCHMSQIHVV